MLPSLRPMPSSPRSPQGGAKTADSPFENGKSYLKAFFGFIGIEPEFVAASGVAMGIDDAITVATTQIHRLAA